MIIPFFITHAGCPHQCVFCDQERITGQSAAPDPAVTRGTIAERLRTDTTGRPVQVAFYGGSFTALPTGMQQAYLEQVQRFIESGDVGSIRVSTRPDAISPGILAFLERFRVTTVELGAQSMDDEVLRRAGRGHSSTDTRQAVRLLKEQGFIVGMQLMPGLPADSPGTFRRTVDEVIGLAPALVRIYPALVIRDTPLEKLYRQGSYRPLSLDDAVSLCADALERFRGAGIEVIRMGLQPTEELGRPGTVVAGPYHPAFRDLVESTVFLRHMRLLAASGNSAFLVNPSDLSRAIGQHRGNVLALQEELGMEVRVQGDPSVPRGEVLMRTEATG